MSFPIGRGNLHWWTPYNVTSITGDTRECSSCPDTCNENGLCGKSCN